jgi:hypothetical protein
MQPNESSSATIADLTRFALELEAIRVQYAEASIAMSKALYDEDDARNANDKPGTVAALHRVVAHGQAKFDLFDRFATLAVEIQTVTSTEQKLELLAAQAKLASAFRSRVSIPELVLAGVDAADGEVSTLHHLIRWGVDDTVKLHLQRTRESRDWLASELAAEERGATLLDPAEGWH